FPGGTIRDNLGRRLFSPHPPLNPLTPFFWADNLRHFATPPAQRTASANAPPITYCGGPSDVNRSFRVLHPACRRPNGRPQSSPVAPPDEPREMKAASIEATGAPDVIRYGDLP